MLLLMNLLKANRTKSKWNDQMFPNTGQSCVKENLYKSMVTYSDNLHNVYISAIVVIFITSFNHRHGYKDFFQWVKKVMSVGYNW